MTKLNRQLIELVEPPVIGRMPKWGRVLLSRARSFSQSSALTEADLLMIWERCEGRCAISGLPFSNVPVGMGRARRPFAPSLDQIKPGKGYTARNVRLVCVAVNFAMNAWGLPTLLLVANGITSKTTEAIEDPQHRDWYRRQRSHIHEAEQIAASLTGAALRAQRARIAALKRSLTLGPAGLKRAAARAVRTRVSASPLQLRA